MTSYPLVVRNNLAISLRVFMLVFLAGVALMSYIAIRDGAPQPKQLWPLIISAFWAAGLLGLEYSLNQESSVVRIDSRGTILVERGKAFRREKHRVKRARFWIEVTEDSEGAPYFNLMMDAPGGDMAVKEGHSRVRLEALQQRLEMAITPPPASSSPSPSRGV